MASVEQLRDALKDTLEARGALGRLRGELRAEIFAALDDAGDAAPPGAGARVPQPPEAFLVAELVREWLVWSGYRHAAAVLVAEAGHPRDPLPKDLLQRELSGVPATPADLPLLARLVAGHRASSSSDAYASTVSAFAASEPVVLSRESHR